LNSENIIANEGKVTFDIMFKAIVPETYERKHMFINLEAQKAFNVGYPIASRGVFYCSRMLSKQYGEVFTNSRYDKLQKVTSIFLCNNVTDKVHKNTITSFELNEHNIYGSITTDKSAYDLLSVVIVCYNDKDNSTANELINMLSVLFSNKITADKKINMLSSKYGIPMTTDFKGEVNSMCNMSQGLIEQGIEQTTINSMFYLINNKHWDFKDCFEMYNIPEEKQATYIEAVNELINNSNN
ncbi:MAG: Rpn family recombination-promoting nuclease/putative transposase, partial [Lachnospiraceae bacterium]|nr:Rpn family recombination-promoting nuclease/putative transposase [Lachnospiraceae bacterium]